MWIKRLKSEAQAKLRHAELLEEETKQLQREGKFNPDGTRNDLETAVA